jgi:hypothetical protein
MWFNILKNKDGKSRFELDGIEMVFDGFTEKQGKHYLQNPESAVAYFNIKNEIYGVSNRLSLYKTVEEFYEVMQMQFAFFKK